MNSGEETAIQELSDKRLEAWNRGDVKAAVSYFTEDAVRVGPYGDEQHGRAEIEAAFEKMRDQMQGSTLKAGDMTIRLLGLDHATLHTGLEIVLPDGNSIKVHAMDVLKKVEGQWMVLEANPKFPAPAPE